MTLALLAIIAKTAKVSGFLLYFGRQRLQLTNCLLSKLNNVACNVNLAFDSGLDIGSITLSPDLCPSGIVLSFGSDPITPDLYPES